MVAGRGVRATWVCGPRPKHIFETKGIDPILCGCLPHGVRVAEETPAQPLFSRANFAQWDTLHAVTHARLHTYMRCVCQPADRGWQRLTEAREDDP
jgi:hypothetical protein